MNCSSVSKENNKQQKVNLFTGDRYGETVFLPSTYLVTNGEVINIIFFKYLFASLLVFISCQKSQILNIQFHYLKISIFY